MTTFGQLPPFSRYNRRENFMERVPANAKDREGNVPTPDDPARGVAAAGTLYTCSKCGLTFNRVTPHLKGFVEPTPCPKNDAHFCQNGPTCDHPFCPEHNDFPESSNK